MGGRYVALLRGVNVGRAKRVSMDKLRGVVEGLGFRDARTVLNSGNVVFTADGNVVPGDAAKLLEEALLAESGVSSRVVVLDSAGFASIADANPLAAVADNPSWLLVGFPAPGADLTVAGPVCSRAWEPEECALTAAAVYLWCPRGVSDSPLGLAVGKALGDGVTMRNWATVLKLRALLEA